MASLNRKYEELSSENTEIETENKKMQKTIETLKVSVRRVNQLETENLDLEGKTHKVRKGLYLSIYIYLYLSIYQ